jgi:hypothetical protein
VSGGVTAVGLDQFMDRYELQAGTAVIVGAGTIYRIRCTEGATAVRVTCLPTRGMPAALTVAGVEMEKMRESGVRVLA